MKTIDFEKYNNLTTQSKHKKEHEPNKKKNYSFLLFHAIETKNHLLIEELALKNKIKPEEKFELNSLPKSFTRNLNLYINNHNNVNFEMSFSFILAFLDLEKGFEHCIQKTLKKRKYNFKIQEDLPTLNIKRDIQYHPIEDIDETIPNTEIIQANITSIFFKQWQEKQENESVLNYLSLANQDEPHLNYSFNQKIYLNKDLTYSNFKSINNKISFIECAVMNDNLDMLKTISKLTPNYENINFFQIRQSILKSNVSRYDFYPKKIIHHLIDHYLNPALEDLNNIDKPHKNNWYKHILDTELEKLIIQHKDKEAFDKLIINNKSLYEKSLVFHKIAKNILTNKYPSVEINNNNGNIERYLRLYSWIVDNNITLKKPLIVYCFEKDRNPTHNPFFKDLMKYEEIKKDFSDYAKEKMLNVQSNTKKIQYLKENGFELNIDIIEKRVLKKLSIFKKNSIDKYAHLDYIAYDVKESLIFIINTIKDIPNLFSELNEKHNIIAQIEQIIEPYKENLKKDIPKTISIYEQYKLKKETNKNQEVIVSKRKRNIL